MELRVQATAPELVHPPTNTTPDEAWPTEVLFNFAMNALGAGDRHEKHLHALARKSVISRFRAGHALSIIQERLTAAGDWCAFQEDRDLLRTKVWEVIKVYQKVTALGHGEEDVAMYGTWAEVMVAYGVANPRKAKPEQTGVTAAESTDDGDVGAAVETGVVTDGLKDDTDEDESEGAAPEQADKEERPPVTADQVVAADAFVNTVGGLKHAAWVLVARSASGGDKAAVKNIVAEVTQAARAILTPAEISEILIVGNAKEGGIKWESV